MQLLTLPKENGVPGLSDIGRNNCSFVGSTLLVIDSRYEKDWMRPVNPNKIPKFDEAKLATYPPGYRYISYCQEATMEGIKVMMDLPGHRRENDSPNGKAHDALYMKCKLWVEGGRIKAEDW